MCLQQILSKNPQGCDGGYAFLAAKWASDVGLVPKSCSVDDPEVGAGQTPGRGEYAKGRINGHVALKYAQGNTYEIYLRCVFFGVPLLRGPHLKG